MTPATDPTAATSDPAGQPERAALRRSVYGLLIVLAVGNMVGRILAVNSVDRIEKEKYLVQQDLNAHKAELENQGVEAAAAHWTSSSQHPLDGRHDFGRFSIVMAMQPAIAVQLKQIEPEVRVKRQQQRPFLSANDRSRWDTIRALVELDPPTYAIDQIVAEPNWDTIDMVKHADRNGEPHLYSSKPPLLSTLIASEYWLIHRLTGATLATHPYAVGRTILITINVLPLIVYFLLLAHLVERYGRSDWGRMFVMAAATFGTFLSTFAVVLNNHIPAAISALIAVDAALRIYYEGRLEWRFFAIAGFFAAFTVPDDLPALSMFAALTVGLLWKFPRQTLIAYVPAALVVIVAFFATNWIANNSLLPPYMHRSHSDISDNWYDYSYVRASDGKPIESYWRKPAGIDIGEPSMAKYAMQALIGTHGIFLLTPVWLLAIPGTYWLGRRYGLRDLALLIASTSIVCIAFYLTREQGDRNYGGMSSGFRWVFWFTPLWLLAALPAADAASQRKWTRWLCGLLLMFSALSASYPTWNPWTLPWLANLWNYLGWS